MPPPPPPLLLLFAFAPVGGVDEPLPSCPLEMPEISLLLTVVLVASAGEGVAGTGIWSGKTQKKTVEIETRPVVFSSRRGEKGSVNMMHGLRCGLVSVIQGCTVAIFNLKNLLHHNLKLLRPVGMYLGTHVSSKCVS